MTSWFIVTDYNKTQEKEWNRRTYTYLLHDLTCVVPGVRGLHYFIVTSTSTLGVECPTPCKPILCQRCFQAFNFQIISYAFQTCVPGTTPRLSTSYDCLSHLSWPCVWIHTLKIHFLCYKDPIHFLVHLMVSYL